MDFLVVLGVLAAAAVCIAAYLYLWGRKHNLKKLQELTKIKKHVHNHH